MNILKINKKCLALWLLVNAAILNSSFAMRDSNQRWDISFKEKVTHNLEEFLCTACCDCPKMIKDGKDCCGKVGVKTCSCIACCGCLTSVVGLVPLFLCYVAGDGTGVCHPYRQETMGGLAISGVLGGGVGVFFSKLFDKWRYKKKSDQRQADAQEKILRQQEEQTSTLKQIAAGIKNLKED